MTCIVLVSAESDDYFSLKWQFSSKGSVNFIHIADLGNPQDKKIIVGSSEQTIVGASGWVNLLDRDGNSEWQYALPGYVSAVAVDDIDGDGKKEIIATVFSRIHVVNADGTERWEGTPRYGYNIDSLHVDDINNDGKKEIMVGAGSGSLHNDLYVMSSSGDTLWSARASGEIQTITSEDLDGDGLKEVLIGCYGRGAMYGRQAAMHVLNSSGKTRFDYGTQRGVASIRVDDIDSDGKREILVGTYQDLIVLDSDGKDLWQYMTNGLIREILSGDIDNDTRKEIILGSNDLYVLDSGGELKWKSAVGPEVYDVSLMDLNKDGLSEVLVASDSGYVIDSKGETLWEYPASSIVKSVLAGDLENDGYFELALGSANKNMYLFQSEIYAKEGEANSNYRIAENHYNKKDFEVAMNYALKAKELYSEIENDKGVRDTETLISKIESDSKRLGQEETQADIYYNDSRNFYLAGDYINASKSAQKAKYKYSYLKDYEAVDDCNEIINNSERFLEIESQAYLLNTSECYDRGDYELALDYARKSRAGFEWLKDEENALKADELLAGIYYHLAEGHSRVRDFENASIFVQRSIYTYLCLDGKSSSMGVGCDSANAKIVDIGALAANISGEKYENSGYKEELRKANSLAARISKEDTGNPIDGISEMIGSNLIYIIVIMLSIIVFALLFGSLYVMSKRRVKYPAPKGLTDPGKGEKKKRIAEKEIDDRVKGSIEKLKKDRLRGEGLPIKQTMYEELLDEV
jgi:hypothetical protein